jgi:hypothetical protein
MAQRPSVYLQEKVANFRQTLSFFATNQGSTRLSLKEKRLVFLAQIDFWEWEMETLIYSFSNFQERSKAWSGGSSLEKLLSLHGILVKRGVLQEVQMKQCWSYSRTDVTAPIEDLNKLIDSWNDLLKMCEEHVLRYDAEEMSALNAQFLRNLDKYRKTKLPLESTT